MQVFKSHSTDQTKKIALEISKQFQGGVIALSGELGAGKTTFVQGFAEGLNIKDKIISPTFVLVRQHKIPKSKNILFHLDLYRLENIKDIQNLGISDFLVNPNNIVLVEWAEKAKKILPQKITTITITTLNETTREIIIT